MKLGFGLNFRNLDLENLDNIFLTFLSQNDNHLAKELLSLRASKSLIDNSVYSNFLLKISPFLDDFLAELFHIQFEVSKLRLQHKDFDIIYECKRKFIQRYALKKYPLEKINEIDFDNILFWAQETWGNKITPEKFAKVVFQWQLDEEKFSDSLDKAAQYAAYMVHNGSLNILFKLPKKIDQDNLINEKTIFQHQSLSRTDFNYYDPLFNLDEALNHAHYCIYCHKQDKDSCSKGMQDKPGCPLKQKISEMNYVKAQGFNLAALAIIVIDNPMVAATGHRICNDCSKACIFQKQDPVNIPLIESNILESVLKLPYGIEIYLLLTRWNPLNIFDPLPKPSINHNILVTGLGPAGFSLSYYLLREGFNVVAIDGLKISPLPFDITKPIKFLDKQKLAEKIPQGFGGVMEYGITSRWDKNNLTILRLILERNNNFKYFDGIRLGSNITLLQAFDLGFDHVAFCTGAGKPKIIQIENFLAKGVKAASDFLMSLQSNGAFLKDSLTNMTIRMPIIIIGGGLTSIDAATESLYYYQLQVEKFLTSYESSKYKQEDLNPEDKLIAKEFIEHAILFRSARGDQNKIRQILHDLGGATIYYRGALKCSPAYKLNHEELIYALAAGVKFVENMNLCKINVDEYDYVKSVEFEYNSKQKIVAARTVIISVGTEATWNDVKNNISYFGDADPAYAGSVVKALASAKNGYKSIIKKLLETKPNFNGTYLEFFFNLDSILNSHIKKIIHLSDNIIELVVHSPKSVENFQPGQFFRLQNYSNDASKLIEPLALTGAYVNQAAGLIHLIVLENGKSSSLCKNLSPGEKIILMGPTGSPTEILKSSNIVLIGGGLGNAVLLSIGEALKENNCKIIYFAGYKREQDRFYCEKIEEMAEIVVWCCEEDILAKNRPQDLTIQGSVTDGIKSYKKFPNKIDRIICIGSASMMEAVKNIKNDYFDVDTKLIVSVNSPMQCMMKGICGQCIQKTQGNNYIFSCVCQDQEADIIDFSSLKSRLAQNSLLEK